MSTKRMRGTVALAGSLLMSPLVLQAQPANTGRVQGAVFDSTRALPLGAANVEMIEVNDPSKLWRSATNARGEFTFDSLAAGTYMVVVTHPRLDSLGVNQLSRGVTLAVGKRERLRFGVPSKRSLVKRICGDTVLKENSGYLRGTLRDAERERVAVSGEVQIRWLDLLFTREGTRRVLSTMRARASENGEYTACGVPVDGVLQLQAWSGSDSSGVIDVIVPSDGVLVQDLMVGKARTVMMTVRDSSAVADSLAPPLQTAVRRGEGRLRGGVKRQDGAVVQNVRLSVWGTGLEQRSMEDGKYLLTGLPTGTYTAEARAIGYAPIRRVVDILPGEGVMLDVSLDKAMLLDTVRIQALGRPRGLEQFERNRKSGFGRFITPEMIEQHPPLRVTDLFRMTPGVRIVPGTSGDRIFMRGASLAPWCVPEVWIDGIKAWNDLPLEMLVSANDIVAAEVYSSGPATPAALSGLSGCGAIVLYTGARKPPAKPPVGK